MGFLGVLSLVSFLLIALSAVEYLNYYKRAAWIDGANDLADTILKASVYYANERGFTLILLRQPSTVSAETLNIIHELRTDGDNEYMRVLTRVNELLTHENHPLHNSLDHLQAKRTLFEEARGFADSYLNGLETTEVKEPWIQTINNFIDALALVRYDAFVLSDDLDYAYRGNIQIKEVVYLVSKLASRERDVIGEVLAKNVPFKLNEVEAINQYRFRVTESITKLMSLVAREDPSYISKEVVEHFNKEFLGSYTLLKEQILLASQYSLPYPINANDWFEESSLAIDSILSFADEISIHTKNSIDRVQDKLFQKLILLLLSVVVILAIILFIFLLTHKRIMVPLKILTKETDRIAGGDLQCTIVLESNDEFGELATSFEFMRASLLIDISKRNEVEKALGKSVTKLEEYANELEVANRELDQFAYVTSHDLKAPLRAIANLSKWIEEDLGEHMQGDIAQQMILLRGRVHRMEGLIDGILEYSRIGRVSVKLVSVDVNSLVQEIIENLSPPEAFVID